MGGAGTPALPARLDHPSTAIRRASAFVLTYCSDPELPAELRARVEVEPDMPTTLTLLIAGSPSRTGWTGRAIRTRTRRF
ncbi:hypothetical protein [Microtetraspora glauca]|uniref:Uncharacterized protein n=1 Tax=Microtetraspora glauca TaxID=1996 RepID=A0ABV3GII2_MICGL